MVSALAIVPVVVLVIAVALALRVDRRRAARTAIPVAIHDEPPRQYAMRRGSISQAIDDAFDALEIKPAEPRAPTPCIELTIDEARPKGPQHAKFDFSDTPDSDAFVPVEELTDDIGTAPTVLASDDTDIGTARTVVARVYDVPVDAFSMAEPTLTVVDDPDHVDLIDELAAFLAREPTPLSGERAARGSQAPIDRARTVRGDLRAAVPQQRSPSYITPTTPRPLRARTPA